MVWAGTIAEMAVRMMQFLLIQVLIITGVVMESMAVGIQVSVVILSLLQLIVGIVLAMGMRLAVPALLTVTYALQQELRALLAVRLGLLLQTVLVLVLIRQEIAARVVIPEIAERAEVLIVRSQGLVLVLLGLLICQTPVLVLTLFRQELVIQIVMKLAEL